MAGGFAAFVAPVARPSSSSAIAVSGALMRFDIVMRLLPGAGLPPAMDGSVSPARPASVGRRRQNLTYHRGRLPAWSPQRVRSAHFPPPMRTRLLATVPTLVLLACLALQGCGKKTPSATAAGAAASAPLPAASDV